MALGKFEDVSERLYQTIYLPEHQFYTYVKYDANVALLPRLPEDDRLTYCSNE